VQKSKSSRRRGFTLIEVMLVMVILVILASISVVAIGRITAKAHINEAKLRVGALKEAIKLFNVDIGTFPTTQSGLQALRSCPADISNQNKWGPTPYIETDVPLDPWGHPYQYSCPGRYNTDSFDLWSLGPDGQDNTSDDIGNWQTE
jgi:general secretion pathway protein G